MNTEELLIERGATHGSFADHARITQRLKEVIHDENAARLSRNQQRLLETQLESLEMIVHKIGRILAGQSDFPDHWDDIAGYAKLCSSNKDK
jgi:hypothetical protein